MAKESGINVPKTQRFDYKSTNISILQSRKISMNQN